MMRAASDVAPVVAAAGATSGEGGSAVAPAATEISAGAGSEDAAAGEGAEENASDEGGAHV